MSRGTKKALMARLISGAYAQTALMFGIKLLPIFLAQILFNMAPFMVAINAHFFINEKI